MSYRTYYNQTTKSSAWLHWSSAGANWRNRLWATYSAFDWAVGFSIGRAQVSRPGPVGWYRQVSLTLLLGPFRFGGQVYNEVPANE